MGLGGISIWQLLIVLAIVALIFGTKRLRGVGGDLGGAIKGFKKALSDDNAENEEAIDDAQKASGDGEKASSAEKVSSKAKSESVD